MVFSLEHSRTSAALEGFNVTDTVDGRQVHFQVGFLCKLLAANVTLVRSLAGLSSRHGVAVRRVVVSADR